MAAGLVVRAGRVDALRRRFADLCAAQLAGRDLRPVETVDAWLDLGEADERLYEAMEALRPFGAGNPAPVWGARNLRVLGSPARVGKNGAHLKLTLAGGGAQMEAVGFNLGPCTLPPGPLDAVFRLRRDAYLGRSRLQLHLRDLAPAGLCGGT
jgi:single-stranded-DNA-specific exonuclease